MVPILVIGSPSHHEERCYLLLPYRIANYARCTESTLLRIHDSVANTIFYCKNNNSLQLNICGKLNRKWNVYLNLCLQFKKLKS